MQIRKKNAIKAFFKNARNAGKTKYPALSVVKKQRDIVNFTMMEKIIPVGIKSKIVQTFRNHTTWKVWYYVNKTAENPNGERKEHFVSIPTGIKKPLGYIEKGTENIFLVNKGAEKGADIYAVNQGSVHFMHRMPHKVTNQEVKQYLTG